MNLNTFLSPLESIRPEKPVIIPEPETIPKEPIPNPFTIPKPIIKPGTAPAPKA